VSQIIIRKSGLLTTIQDGGRWGYDKYGLTKSGALDLFSFRVGNALVGNDLYQASLETTLLGPEIEVKNGQLFFAITGANLGPCLNNKPINMWQTYRAFKHDTVSFTKNIDGCRSYLSIAGQIKVPEILGSRSTFLGGKIGGYHGRKLLAGDEIGILDSNFIGHHSIILRKLKKEYIPTYYKKQVVRCVMGPQNDYFSEKGIETFLTSEYTITNHIDRCAYRLEGPLIEHKDKADIISDGTVWGSIQVPASGLPIIFMADRPSNGGYAKIATVISCDLPIIAQMKMGDKVRFKSVSIEEAHSILKTDHDFFKRLISA